MPTYDPDRPPPPDEPKEEEFLLVAFGANCPLGPLGPELVGKPPAGKIILFAPLGPDPLDDESNTPDDD